MSLSCRYRQSFLFLTIPAFSLLLLPAPRLLRQESQSSGMRQGKARESVCFSFCFTPIFYDKNKYSTFCQHEQLKSADYPTGNFFTGHPGWLCHEVIPLHYCFQCMPGRSLCNLKPQKSSKTLHAFACFSKYNNQKGYNRQKALQLIRDFC